MQRKTYKKEQVLVSFSGGRTSAYLAINAQLYFPDADILYIFANTGQEHEKTLRFVDRVDKEYGLNLVWVEADIDQRPNEGTTHTIVNFDTACRDARLFDDMCMKYGLCNSSWPHCTRELKEKPIHSYAKEFFGSKNTHSYQTALGIRADEYRRVRERKEFTIVYPLVKKLITKDDIIYFWRQQPFDLDLMEHQGNCLWCWKKGDPKHFMVMDDDPSVYRVPAILENKYSMVGPDEGPRQIFRGNRTTADLWQWKMEKILKGIERPNMWRDLGCQESCEMYAT